MKRSPKIAFVMYTNPGAYPPVVNASTMLAERGAEVGIWGIGQFGACGDLKVETRPGMTQWSMSYAPPGWRQKVHYGVFVVLCVLRTLFWRPRFVYVSDRFAYPVGLLVSCLPGLKVVAHEHDTPPNGTGAVDKILDWARRRLFKRAEFTVIPQTERAELVRKSLRPKRIQVVWNCPRVDEIVPVSPRERSDNWLLWYHGSIVPEQFPDSVVRALKLLPEGVQLRFAGYETIGCRSYVSDLKKLAGSLGVAERVEYVGAKPTRAELFAAASECDIGLSLFARSFRERMVGASNKPFDFLACGLAVVTNDTPEWKDFYADCPGVVACNPESPEEIAALVNRMIGDPEKLQRERVAGQNVMRALYNYDRQFDPVCREILNEPES